MIHLIAIAGYLQTHLLSLVLALVATYVIGAVWHGPLFGKQWIALNKIPMPTGPATFMMMLPGLIANFFLTLCQVAVLGRTFQIVQLDNIGHALIIAVIIWLPFTALVLVNIYAWAGKPVKLIVLDCAHALISILAVAAVLYVTL